MHGLPFSPRRMLMVLIVASAGDVKTAWAQGLVPENDVSPRVVIDEGLRERTVRVLSMSATTISARDASGRTVTIPRSEVLALIPVPTTDSISARATRERTWREADSASPRQTSIAMLVDGQQLPGSAMMDPAPDHLAWNSRLWGPVSIPLDSMSVLQVRPIDVPPKRDAPPAKAGDDQVVFMNGDKVLGLVSSVVAKSNAPAKLPNLAADSRAGKSKDRLPSFSQILKVLAPAPLGTLTIDRMGKTNSVPLERVDHVTFANAIKPPEGAMVWLYDGTIASVGSVVMPPNGPATLTLPKGLRLIEGVSVPTEHPEMTPGTPTVRGSDIRSIVFDAGRLRPLAALPMRTSGEGRVSRLDLDTAALNAADMLIDGPASVEWDLPANATRFACTLELPLSARVWGDCTLTISHVVQGKTTNLLSQRFRADSASATMNVVLPGGKTGILRAELVPGSFGPIQNRIVVRRGLILTASGGSR